MVIGCPLNNVQTSNASFDGIALAHALFILTKDIYAKRWVVLDSMDL